MYYSPPIGCCTFIIDNTLYYYDYRRRTWRATLATSSRTSVSRRWTPPRGARTCPATSPTSTTAPTAVSLWSPSPSSRCA
eukprot:7621006-Pyramimonas_sp.AAC.1